MRDIAANALESYDANLSVSARKLKRILRIYRAASSSSSPVVVRDLLDVPNELLQWLILQSRSTTNAEEKTVRLLRFLADEATPSDVLEAAQAWTAESEMDARVEMILTVLQTLLRRAAAGEPRSHELSGALFRLRQARVQLLDSIAENDHRTAEQQAATHGLRLDDDQQQPEMNIWKRMSVGMVAVLK